MEIQLFVWGFLPDSDLKWKQVKYLGLCDSPKESEASFMLV